MDERVKEWFDRNDYIFHTCSYEKGEILISPTRCLRRILFVLEGEIAIYSINEEGNVYPITLNEGFTVLGDMEYAGETESAFYVEARTKVRGIYLDLETEREKLNMDVRFLHHIIQEMRKKIVNYDRDTTFSPSVEVRLKHYLHHHDRIENIESLSYQLHCSRRQLIRVLKKLEQEGVIIHRKRGMYVRSESR